MSNITVHDSKGKPVRQIFLPTSFPHMRLIQATTFTPDGRRLICVVTESRERGRLLQRREWAFIWRAQDWQLEYSAPLNSFYGVGLKYPTTLTSFYSGFPKTESVAVSPDCSLVALTEVCQTGWAWFWWRIEQWWLSWLLRAPVISSPPSQVVVRRIPDGRAVTTLQRFGRHVTNCTFSPDGRYLAVVHDGRTIALWERN